jgi:hypothetical protein
MQSLVECPRPRIRQEADAAMRKLSEIYTGCGSLFGRCAQTQTGSLPLFIPRLWCDRNVCGIYVVLGLVEPDYQSPLSAQGSVEFPMA